MAKKMTLRQKEKLFDQRKNANFQASTALDGHQIKAVTLPADEALARLEEVRANYER
ncbi:YhfG family protein [Nissabacter sp. SGAir0207]|uniref:YhfG family protein n=1 Tax=Nissabacter sp. SGAir0207 TaxID=2126321 RepID=UPI0026D7ECBC